MTGRDADADADAGRGGGGPTLTFLSDFGLADEFVGVVHAVMRRICPDAAVVDLCHQVPPHDVGAGAAMLARAAPYLAAGPVLAVVDPGVGTVRRRVAVAAGHLTLVGPDNGLLVPAAEAVGGVRRAVQLDRPELWLGEPAGTFDGRDVFGPVAAHLAGGLGLEEVGSPLDPASLHRLPGPEAAATAAGYRAEVVWVDRFGNAALALGPAELGALAGNRGAGLEVVGPDGHRHPAAVVAAFGEVGADRVGLLVDSSGQVALVCDRSSAADRIGVRAGDRVEVRRPAG